MVFKSHYMVFFVGLSLCAQAMDIGYAFRANNYQASIPNKELPVIIDSLGEGLWDHKVIALFSESEGGKAAEYCMVSCGSILAKHLKQQHHVVGALKSTFATLNNDICQKYPTQGVIGAVAVINADRVTVGNVGGGFVFCRGRGMPTWRQVGKPHALSNAEETKRLCLALLHKSEEELKSIVHYEDQKVKNCIDIYNALHRYPDAVTVQAVMHYWIREDKNLLWTRILGLGETKQRINDYNVFTAEPSIIEIPTQKLATLVLVSPMLKIFLDGVENRETIFSNFMHRISPMPTAHERAQWMINTLVADFHKENDAIESELTPHTQEFIEHVTRGAHPDIATVVATFADDVF